MALRLLLGCIQRIAARHRKTLIPLMSCSIDFYVRVFVQLRVSPLAVKQTASSMAMVFQCQGCKSIQSQQLGQWKETKGTWTHHQVPTACPECQSGYVMAGPTYIGPLHDTKLVTKVLQQVQENKNKYGTYARILGMVSVISEEVSVPFYMTLRTLSSALHCNSIPMLDL
ncbi:RNA methyltransferase tRNA(m5U54)methyltransferase, partial [Coelomomyces lativittatus]